MSRGENRILKIINPKEDKKGKKYIEQEDKKFLIIDLNSVY